MCRYNMAQKTMNGSVADQQSGHKQSNELDTILDEINTLLYLQEDCERKRRAALERIKVSRNNISLTEELLHTSLARASELDACVSDRREEVMERQKYLTAVETLLVEERGKTDQLQSSLENLRVHKDEQLELIKELYEYLSKNGIPRDKLDSILKQSNSVKRQPSGQKVNQKSTDTETYQSHHHYNKSSLQK